MGLYGKSKYLNLHISAFYVHRKILDCCLSLEILGVIVNSFSFVSFFLIILISIYCVYMTFSSVMDVLLHRKCPCFPNTKEKNPLKLPFPGQNL